MRIFLVSTLLLASSAEAQVRGPAPGAEALFAAARGYTVEVHGSIPAAFDEDSAGAGTGTGFLIDADRGWILTNAHVAGHSPAELEVRWGDGTHSPATVVYVDGHVDAAILAVDPGEAGKHPVATLACGPVPGAGHPVGVLGHPVGFRYNASRGIISGYTSRFGQDLLTMDAAVNPGNSGGPVISLESGQVVGIATGTMNSDEVHGITLAVPIRFPCHLLELLRAGRDPSPFDPRLAFTMNNDGEMTLTVGANRLPAGSLPLESGDEVLSVGSPPVAVTTYSELVDQLRSQGTGTTLRVRRAGREVLVSGPLPKAQMITRRKGLLLSGALLATSTPEYAPWWLFQRPILSVQDVAGGSDAESAGFGYGDVVFRVDGEPVTELAAVAALAKRAAETESPLHVLVLRIRDEDNDRKATFRMLELESPTVEDVGALPPTRDAETKKKAAP